MKERETNEKTIEFRLPQNVVKILKWGAISIISILLILYLVYQLYQLTYTKIVTEQALSITFGDEIESVGITVRDENLITSEYSGVVVPTVAEGGKVSKGQTIAYIFKSADDANAYNRIIEIDNEIAEFKSMETAKEKYSSIDKLLDERINSLSEAVNNGDLDLVDEIRSDITYLLNKRQIYMNKVDNFDARIKQLESEKSTLEAKYNVEPYAVKASNSGYFVSSVDGYESTLKTENSKELTAADVDKLLDSFSDIDTSRYIGKIADDYKWHMVSAIPTEDAKRLTVGRTYTIKLPYAEAGSVRASLESVNIIEGDDRAVVQFTCNYLIDELAAIRTQPIVIQVKSYDGIGIKTDALRTQTVKKTQMVSASDAHIYNMPVSGTDDVEVSYDVEQVGVYVLWGNEVVFRWVDVLYSRDGITVVRSNTLDSQYLKLYDEVIVEGRDLYDGKIINN